MSARSADSLQSSLKSDEDGLMHTFQMVDLSVGLPHTSFPDPRELGIDDDMRGVYPGQKIYGIDMQSRRLFLDAVFRTFDTMMPDLASDGDPSLYRPFGYRSFSAYTSVKWLATMMSGYENVLYFGSYEALMRYLNALEGSLSDDVLAQIAAMQSATTMRYVCHVNHRKSGVGSSMGMLLDAADESEPQSVITEEVSFNTRASDHNYVGKPLYVAIPDVSFLRTIFGLRDGGDLVLRIAAEDVVLAWWDGRLCVSLPKVQEDKGPQVIPLRSSYPPFDIDAAYLDQKSAMKALESIGLLGRILGLRVPVVQYEMPQWVSCL